LRRIKLHHYHLKAVAALLLLSPAREHRDQLHHYRLQLTVAVVLHTPQRTR
jgi:hypothetical protein